jgi:hypothetical protein
LSSREYIREGGEKSMAAKRAKVKRWGTVRWRPGCSA